MKRKKRLEKSIESLKERIAEHEIKLKEAKEQGKEELATYYEGEIATLKREEQKRETLLDKQ